MNQFTGILASQLNGAGCGWLSCGSDNAAGNLFKYTDGIEIVNCIKSSKEIHYMDLEEKILNVTQFFQL